MKVFGLVGHPLSHSFSEKYFTEKFKKENLSDCCFKNFPLQTVDELPELLKREPDICGLSVTIPHKEKIMDLLDKVDEEAREIGAVNCIKRSSSGSEKGILKGYNTDVVGFGESIKPLLQLHHTHALVLGTGGASKAVTKFLDISKIYFKLVSRNGSGKSEDDPIWSYDMLNAKILSKYTLIVNTTPLGMFPDIDAAPVLPYEHLNEHHLLYDLIYNPKETKFLRLGRQQGAAIKNGLEMLHLQAEAAWKIWNS